MGIFTWLAVVSIFLCLTLDRAIGQIVFPSPTAEELTRAQLILEEYDNNSTKLTRFAVLADVNFVQENPKDSAYSSDDIYLMVKDSANGLKRFDSVASSYSASLGVSRQIVHTVLLGEKTVEWFVEGRSANSRTLREESDVDKNDTALRDSGKMEMLDPFYLAISGYNAFIKRRTVTRDRGFPRLQDYKISRVEDDLRGTVVELEVSEKYGVYYQVFFSREVNLPVESRLVNGHDRKNELSIVKSKWGNFGNHPVPEMVVAHQLLGSKPSLTKRTWSVEFTWKNLPKKGAKTMFQSDEGTLTVPTSSIVEYIRSGEPSK